MNRVEEIEQLKHNMCEEYGVMCNECPATDCANEMLAEKLIDMGYRKEQDLLKEFVEWQAKQYKDIYHLYEEEIKEEKDHDDYIWLVGRKAGIGVIRQSLKTAVEKFLEERK